MFYPPFVACSDIYIFRVKKKEYIIYQTKYIQLKLTSRFHFASKNLHVTFPVRSSITLHRAFTFNGDNSASSERSFKFAINLPPLSPDEMQRTGRGGIKSCKFP
ncbi:MAG: hypothetical protein DRI57_26270 [Deltaproteobacteria bacterium]|nr:MAG: hypothetical protein DRI57_26270 [Deltaproteobacteria bacterium]